MKERPILFSGEMVRAILEGRKTQTRRVLRLAVDSITSVEPNGYGKWFTNLGGSGFLCPYGKPDDHLWVREKWGRWNGFGQVVYAADEVEILAGKWKPSIHMPRWVSRITLEVKDVGVERLQGISEEDCCHEMGCPVIWPGPGPEPYKRDLRGCFKILWDSLNAKRGYSWDVNPFVWVITFRRI